MVVSVSVTTKSRFSHPLALFVLFHHHRRVFLPSSPQQTRITTMERTMDHRRASQHHHLPIIHSGTDG